MRSGLARIAVSGAILIAAGVVACLEQLPRTPTRVCAIDEVQALPAAGFAQTADGCTSCLETPCCDTIGNCDDNCRKSVRAAHACVLDAGPLHEAQQEQACIVDSGISDAAAATNAYRCMRDTCGEACALPVCKVDPSYGLFVDLSCDQCLSSSCCPQIDACAKDRGCKLLTDCIVQKCKSLFGTRTSLLTNETIPMVRNAVCNNEPLPPDADGGLDCVESCFNDVIADGGAVPNQGPTSGCIGFEIVACAVAADCKSACTGADAGF
ncbi:MAG TPA: hypothetical protein VIF62_15385 [Labilithrix sp.]